MIMKIIIESGKCRGDFMNDLGEDKKNLINKYEKKNNYKIAYVLTENHNKITLRAIIFAKMYNGIKIGGIGMLRCGESYKEFRELIDKAELWFGKENVVKFYLPMDFNTFHSYRVVSDYFENPPFLLEQNIEPHLYRFIKYRGFKSVKKYYSYIVKNPVPVIHRLESFALRAKKQNIEVIKKEISKPDMSLLKELYEITDNAFSNAFLYESIDFDEFRNIYKPLINNNIGVKLMIAKINDKNVGYLFAVEDKYKENRWIVKTIAVKKAYSNAGVGALLTYDLYRRAVRFGIKELIHAYMSESISTKRFSETFGEIYREYSLYGKEI